MIKLRSSMDIHVQYTLIVQQVYHSGNPQVDFDDCHYKMRTLIGLEGAAFYAKNCCKWVIHVAFIYVHIFMDQSKKSVNHKIFLISVHKIFQTTKTTKLKHHPLWYCPGMG